MKRKLINSDASNQIEKFKKYETFFENFIDLIPMRIYLNNDDRLQWLKLLNKNSEINRKDFDSTTKSKTDKNNSTNEDVEENDAVADDDEEDGDDDDNGYDMMSTKRSKRFDPIYFKTVSQIYKDFEKIKNTEQKTILKTKNSLLQTAKNPAIKIENKNSSKGSLKAKKMKLDKEKVKLSKHKSRKNAKNKKKLEKANADSDQVTLANAKPQTKPILNKNGDIVYSKFDFSIDKTSVDNRKGKNKLGGNKLITNAKPKDYKNLVKQLQEKKEKFQQLKESEPEKAFSLETKDKWKTVLDKASGIKVKDDVSLLKKSIKKMEKKKEKSKKLWTERIKSVEKSKKETQDKRQKNIEQRKKKKNESKIKRLKKKGRLITGF